MDQFGQIGPEKGDYPKDVRAIADALRHAERAVTFALTHRLTRQQVTIALKRAMEVVGQDYGGGPPGTRGGAYAFVAVDEHGAYWFALDSYNDAGYIATKLSINPIDAETLAEFLVRLAAELHFMPATSATAIVERLHLVSDGEVA